jgi:hypothetical protein
MRHLKIQRAISIGLIAILNIFDSTSVALLENNVIFGHHCHQLVDALELLQKMKSTARK